MKQNTVSQRIVSELRTKIRSGVLAPGDRVPSAREIVRDYEVAIATATKVLAMLRREGLVRSKPGIGTVVRGERGPDLSRERIVEAAIAVADDEGIEGLSMRLLAKELGVATMSLYRHVSSREELLFLMTNSALGEEEMPVKPKAWRAKLEAIADLQWGMYRRHPWLAQILSMTRPQLLEKGVRHTEYILAAIDTLGLGTEASLQSAVMFLSYIRGMAGSLAAEILAEQDTGQTSTQWMLDREADFVKLTAKQPTLSRLAGQPDVDMSIDALFHRGVTVILDGLEAQSGRS